MQVVGSMPKKLWEHGLDKPLPYVFSRGGDERKVWWQSGNPRVNAVLGLVTLHHMEFRHWSAAWGPHSPAVGRFAPAISSTRPGWHEYDGPWPRDPFFFHPQLQTRVGSSSSDSSSSTLLRACIGVRGDRARYESRDVCIVSLPELFLHFLHKRCAAEIYGEWLEAEVIIGCKHRRGTDSTSRWR